MRNISGFSPIPTFRTTQGPIIKTLNEARNFLIRSSLYNEQRDKLNSSLTVTPQYSFRMPDFMIEHAVPGNRTHNMPPSSFSTAPRGPTQPQQRRRLGRSPSPSPSPSPTRFTEQNRATNTPSPVEKFLARDASKSALREALSRLRLTMPRDSSVGAASIGAASLGARRDAPTDKRAPSVRSDERPLATQGDMLNSIKFQRRYRDTHNVDKINTTYQDKIILPPRDKPGINVASSRTNTGLRLGFKQVYNMTPKDKPNINAANSKTSTGYRLGFNQDFSTPRNLATNATKPFYPSVRPPSPKGRRNTTSFY